MPYTYITFGDAKAKLAGLLGDYHQIFWNAGELGQLVVEALRTWNAGAQYWRGRGTGVTSAGEPYYDLGTTLTPAILERSVTDTELVADICAALMEPAPIGTTWVGTDKFRLTDILDAIQQARDNFINQTAILTTKVLQAAVISPPAGRVILSDQNIMDLRRVFWLKSEDGEYEHLHRTDEWAANTTQRRWFTDAGTPEEYSITSIDPLTIQLIPVPLNNGSLEMLTLEAGGSLTNLGSIVDVPNDLIWVIKWGALAILLNRDSQVRDPQRVAYCVQRWNEGLAIAVNSFASAVQGQIQGFPVSIEDIDDLESTRDNWRNESGEPEQMCLAGVNMLAFAPVPDGIYSFTVDAVRNAPIPIVDTDFVELGKEYLDIVLGYAQHIASFKMGGPEFQMTMPLLKDFYDGCISNNAKLNANNQFYEVMQSRAIKELRDNPNKVELTGGNS